MSSIQDDDNGLRPSLGPSDESNADMSMYRDAGGSRSQRSEGQDPEMELNAEGVSDQGPAESTGGDYTAGARDSESTGDRFPNGVRASESFASKLTFMIQGIVQRTQTAMEGLLNNVNEIDGFSVEVMEELHNARECAVLRKSKLEEDRDKVHEAACRVLEVLNITNNMMDVARPQPGSGSDCQDRGDYGAPEN